MMKIVKVVIADVDRKVYLSPYKYKKEWREMLDRSESYTAEEFLELDLNYYQMYEPMKCGYEWVLDGKPSTLVEELLAYKLGLSGPSYDRIFRRFPEDLIESRTDWDVLKNYADDMKDFLNTLCSYLPCKI